MSIEQIEWSRVPEICPLALWQMKQLVRNYVVLLKYITKSFMSSEHEAGLCSFKQPSWCYQAKACLSFSFLDLETLVGIVCIRLLVINISCHRNYKKCKAPLISCTFSASAEFDNYKYLYIY